MTAATSDVSSLTFVDPDKVDDRWRIVIFAPPGNFKTITACSAPGPILAINADRPGAYRTARRLHAGKSIHEVRFESMNTVRDVLTYARSEQANLGTVVLDPFNAIYDRIVADNTHGAKPNWQKVNEQVMGLVTSFRALDVNLILVAHERVEKDEDGQAETKIYPQLGGPALIQKVMGEMDIVARMFKRDATEQDPEQWMAQFVVARGYQCKDSSGMLGRTRAPDVTEWIATANARPVDEEPVPWEDEPEQPEIESDQRTFEVGPS